MKKFLLFLFATILFFTGSVYSQTITATTYAFNRATAGPTALVWTSLIGSNSDNVASAVTDIGFTFWFAGTPYTQFSVSENGLMTLGSTQISGTDVSNNMASATTLVKIAPYWDDLATGTTGSVGYNLQGTAPGRTLYINWNVTVPKNTAGAANTTFQVKLVENTGQIILARGATPINAGAYTIGIGKSGTDYASVNALAASATCVYWPTASANTNTNAINQCSYNFTPDYTAPTISTQTIPNTFGTANRILIKTITDVSGVPTSGSFVPTIYYKKNVGGTYVSQPGVWSSPSTWTFTVDHSLVGGVVTGDQIYYYVVAQDQSATGRPNVGSYPAGVVATNVNTVTTPPASPSVYLIGGSFSGTKTVGTGGDYTSLTLAGGLFDQINAGQLSGNLTLNIISDLTGETGAVSLNAWAEGVGGPFTVTINPVGARTITASGPIRFNGTQSASIDGLNDGTNSLLINSTGGAVTLQAGASGNTITRTTLKGYSSSGSGVILVSNSTATPCNNNIISYNSLTSSNASFASYQGICFTGSSSTGTGNIIDHNTFTNFGFYAIHKEYVSTSHFVNFTISNNEIYNTAAFSERQYFVGISLESTTGTSNIFNNKIHDLLVIYNNLSGAGITGISTTNTAGDVTNIYNNVICYSETVNDPLQAWYGITSGNAGTANIYYNSIYIGGSSTNSSIARGINKTGTGNSDIRNNVVYIARTGSVNSSISVVAPYTSTNNFSGDPGFISVTDLQPDVNNVKSNLLDAHGVPVAGITTDILGNTRNATTPDIGAYEFVGTPITYTVSGNAGMPGVTLSWTDGTAKTTTSDAGGAYSFIASYGWSGTVTPALTGYSFTPVNRIYSNVLSDQLTQDYTATPIVYTISGNAGIAGAVLSYTDGTAKTATADGTGLYSFTVSYNWSGTVTPTLAGFSFTPASIAYTNVLSNQLNQNYTTAPVFLTISGNAGVAGATLNWSDGTLKSTTSDAGGLYSFTVSYNWSGSVTPTLTGYTFTPSSKVYSNVIADQLTQNFTANVSTFIIIGNAGVGGAVISWFDGIAKTTTTTVDGDYNITVPFNWTGTVTPSKAGYAFSPLNIAYTNVVSNQSAQNYVATPTLVVPAGLVSYWKLNEASGNFYADLTGVNNGTGNPSPTAVAGQVSGAQQFDGISTKIDVPANPTFDFAANGNFSVEFWYKGTVLPTSLGIAIGRVINGNTYWGIGITEVGQAYFFMVNGANTAINYGSTNIVDGNWHQLTATRNGTTGESKIYVDGSLNGSATQSFSVNFSSPTSKLEIGSIYNTYLLNGNLDEVAIHNVELTPAEILQHYTNGVHGVDYYTNYAPVITSVAPLNGAVGQLYSYTVRADGYPVPTYSLTTAPAGMTIDAATGLIQWIPASASYANVTVQVSNGVSPPSTQSFIIVVPVPPVVPAGLVAYWKLNEASGTIYADLTGTNNGTGIPSPTAVTGKIGGAQLFDGNTTKINVSANPTFDFAANGNFSVEFWYKGTILPTSLGIAIGRIINGNTYWGIGISEVGQAYFFMVNGANTALTYGSTNIVDGNWHHLTATRNGTTGESKIYVDGSLNGSATQSFSANFSSPTSKLEIGSIYNTNFMNGSLDEIALHNVELTPAEILQHYTNGLHGVDYYTSCAPVITSVAPLNGAVGQLYSYTVKADGYPAPTYSLTTSPVGMTINSTTGLIQWTPSVSGNVNVTVLASNSVNPVSTQSFTIAVTIPVIVPAGMVAYWKLDELAGNTYIDFTGINNGAGNQSPTAVTGQIGGAQLFDGISTKIDVPANPTFDFAANGNFSVEFWYKGTILPTSLGIAIGRVINGNTYWGIGISEVGQAYFFMVNGANTALTYGSTNIVDGNWHHLTATRNGTTGESKIYVDGSLNGSATQSFSANFSSPTSKLEIGSIFNSYLLNAILDDLAVYNIELLSADVLQHYNNGLTGGVLAVPLAQNSALMTTGLDNTETTLDLSAFAFRNVEIRIKGNVSREALATLYDLQGRVVRIQKLEEGNLNIMPTPGIKNAIYILSVIDNGKKQTFKIPVNAY